VFQNPYNTLTSLNTTERVVVLPGVAPSTRGRETFSKSSLRMFLTNPIERNDHMRLRITLASILAVGALFSGAGALISGAGAAAEDPEPLEPQVVPAALFVAGSIGEISPGLGEATAR